MAPTARSGRADNRNALFVAGAVAVVFAIIAVVVLGGGSSDKAEAGEVLLEPVSSDGPFPWTGSVVADDAPTSVPLPPSEEPTTTSSAGAGPVAIAAVRGDRVGIYGGTRQLAVCDKEQLVSFLENNPGQGRAWAAVLGVTPSAIRSYVDSLTSVVLAADTRVTNHGYRNGEATPRQAVLQAGTAVMVDDRGVPRVRCYCGNPLTPAVLASATPTYVGAAWPAFTPERVIVVQPAAAPIQQITTINIDNGRPLVIPIGTTVGTTPTTSAPGTPSTTRGPELAAASTSTTLPLFTPNTSPTAPTSPGAPPQTTPRTAPPQTAPPPTQPPPTQPPTVYRLAGFTVKRDYRPAINGNKVQPGTTSSPASQRQFPVGWTHSTPPSGNSANGNLTFTQLPTELSEAQLKNPIPMSVTMNGDWNSYGYGVFRYRFIILQGEAVKEARGSAPDDANGSFSTSATASTGIYPPRQSGGRATTQVIAYMPFGDEFGVTLTIDIIYERS